MVVSVFSEDCEEVLREFGVADICSVVTMKVLIVSSIRFISSRNLTIPYAVVSQQQHIEEAGTAAATVRYFC